MAEAEQCLGFRRYDGYNNYDGYGYDGYFSGRDYSRDYYNRDYYNRDRDYSYWRLVPHHGNGNITFMLCGCKHDHETG